MKHDWQYQKDFKPINNIIEREICKTCGCIKDEMSYFKGQEVFYYERSGIDLFRREPECLDWNNTNLD